MTAIEEETLSGGGITMVLARQRRYAEARSERSRCGLVVPEAFVRGIRDLGYRGNGDAIAELIDNALQASAERIDIVFGYDASGSRRKPIQLAVIDDGHGMEPAMIRMAVMWGGTHRENDRSGLGRYGYGLPCASVSLGRRFTILSKVADGAVHAVELDLDALADGDYTDRRGDIIVPPSRPAALPGFVADHIASAYPSGWNTGTIILIDKLDRLEWRTTQSLRKNLCRQFGATYHKLRAEAVIYVDNEFVEPIDPLFLTPGFQFHDLDADRAHALDPVRVEVIDPDTRACCGVIGLRYAWLPPSFGSADKDRDAVGLNANPRFSVLKEYHGIIFSRNGRMIDVQTRTPWTSFINNDRYIKIEIEFSATLDEVFGVTTSKQQVTVSPLIWDLLEQAGLPKAIEQLRGKVKEAKSVRRVAMLAPRSGASLLSEHAVTDAAQLAARAGGGQLAMSLAAAPYHLQFEHESDAPFFRIERSRDGRTLYLNASHRFHHEIYFAPGTTAEMRTALEVLLFSFGDELVDRVGGAGSYQHAEVAAWSRRLDRTLGMLAADLAATEEMNTGKRPEMPTAASGSRRLLR